LPLPIKAWVRFVSRKYAIFSHDLSCTHDFDTRITTALLVGEDIEADFPSSEEPTLRLGLLHEMPEYLDAFSSN
jgi:hypothetical protein